jgi:hypothetical protein
MSDYNLFQVPATIQSVRTLVDGGTKLDVITNELNPTELAQLFSLKSKFGWFVFKENTINIEDLNLPDVKIDKGEKTPSQRLKSVLYVLWKQSDQKKTPDEFYKYYMDKIIESIKEKLI